MKRDVIVPVVAKNYFSLILGSLKLFGIGIEEIENPLHSFLYDLYSFILLSTCIYYYFLVQTIDLFQHLDDFDYVSFTLCYMVTQGTGMLKGTLLLYNKKHVREYLKKLERDLFLPNVNRGGIDEHKFINRAVLICNIQALVFYFFVVMIVSILTIQALISDVAIDVYENGTNTTVTVIEKVLPYNIYYPFDVKSHYNLALSYQVFACTLFGLYIGACDALITGIMVHVKAQILILKNSLSYITERSYEMYKSNNKKMMDRNQNSLEKAPVEVQRYATLIIRDIIKHHQGIISLAEETEDEFNLVMLAQFFGSLMLMCLLLFQLSLYGVDNPKFFSFGLYLCLMLFQLLIYCWNGNELSLESMDVARATFECDWMHYDTDSQKALMLMIMRSQRPLRLTAGKFAFLSLETYVTILRGSASYYLALKNMNE